MRFEETYWLRLLETPGLEALLAAGPLGQTRVPVDALPNLPFQELQPIFTQRQELWSA